MDSNVTSRIVMRTLAGHQGAPSFLIQYWTHLRCGALRDVLEPRQD